MLFKEVWSSPVFGPRSSEMDNAGYLLLSCPNMYYFLGNNTCVLLGTFCVVSAIGIQCRRHIIQAVVVDNRFATFEVPHDHRV